MNGKTTTFEWPVSHFDLDQIAESGQVFRWERRGPCNYLIPAGDQVCVAYMTTPDKLAIRCPENRAAFWRYYFGLGDPYPEYWQTINTWVEWDGESYRVIIGQRRYITDDSQADCDGCDFAY